MRLFSYKLISDTGFAPNPFHGICTLATCKPRIREAKLPGDWIAGFTSAQLNMDPVGEERLIYLMQVKEKVSLGDYFTCPRFRAKIPDLRASAAVRQAGDNIYRPAEECLVQVLNRWHTVAKDHAKDVGGRCVLVAERFCYFGSEPLVVPPDIRPVVPRGQSSHGSRTWDEARAEAFIAFVLGHGEGVHAAPTSSPHGDHSWRQA